MQKHGAHLAAVIAALAMLACADRIDPVRAVAPTAADSPPVSLSSTASVPDCGFEDGLACPVLVVVRCDRGLALDLNGTPLNTSDDRCVNDRRHLVGADFRGTWVDWALANQRTLAVDEPINWVMHLTTHNAFNNQADGYFVDPNQVWSMSDQLDLGTRMLWLDLHWFNGAVRLCHGRDVDEEEGEDPVQQHQGCSPGDRQFSYGIQEIATWVTANPEEILLMDFESYVEDRFDDVVETLDHFLGSKIYRPADRSSSTFWPSRRELLTQQKRVIIGALGSAFFVGDNFRGRTHNGYMPGFGSDSRFIKDFSVQRTNGIVTGCNTVNRHDGSTVSVLTRDGLFRVVGEDRTRLALLFPDAHPGYVESSDVADLAACGVPLLSFDLLSADRATEIGDLIDRIPDQERQPFAVWSWRSGDRGGGGDAVVLRGSDGRWTSSAPSAQHRFACGRARSETSRNPGAWTDRIGAEWHVTSREGTWREGGRACLDEFGEGFVFSVPVNGYANGQLRLADATRGDVWLNYNDIKQEGNWIINQRPLADAGVKQTVECSGHHGTLVHLDGRSSSDPDGDQITYEWHGPFGTATGAQPAVLVPLGTHVITMIADDGFGGVSVDEVVIEVVDTTPPEIRSATPTPSELWAPNHKMAPVAVAVDVSDICDPTPTCRIVSVASSEPANGAGDGNTLVDWEITGALTLNLRAERSGKGDGRVYTITVECTDDSGNTSSTAVRVTVAHDRGKP
jgi:hypothetical protein